jgi:SAM-dependent methyltransferase
LVGYDATINKEKVSRENIFSVLGNNLNFLDVGARDGRLTYLLGIDGNLNYDKTLHEKNLEEFRSKYNYYGMDINPSDASNILMGDICEPNYIQEHDEFIEFFDVIYSNNVFEHLKNPFIAMKNISAMLKPNGTIITIVPFSQRYHESPGDYFRYTHKGVEALLESCGKFRAIVSGYDLLGRRNNWQGGGDANDIVPLDSFGAWRETWFTVNISKKDN